MLIFYQVLYGGWIQINENHQNAETSWCILIDSITSWYASYYKTFLNFQQQHTCLFETPTSLSLPGYHHSWFSYVWSLAACFHSRFLFLWKYLSISQNMGYRPVSDGRHITMCQEKVISCQALRPSNYKVLLFFRFTFFFFFI